MIDTAEPLYIALITAVPLFNGVTTPLSTLTTSESLEDHSTTPVTSRFVEVPSTVAHTFNCFVVFPTVSSIPELDPSMSMEITSPVAAKALAGNTAARISAITRRHFVNFLLRVILFSPLIVGCHLCRRPHPALCVFYRLMG
ncbi:hypothetical protein D3C73_1182970 [compost metagenome]